MTARDELRQLITDLAVVHGKVVLSSGREADYYVDLRRVTLHHTAAPLIGQVMRDLTADWAYEATLVGLHGSLTPDEMLIPVLVD